MSWDWLACTTEVLRAWEAARDTEVRVKADDRIDATIQWGLASHTVELGRALTSVMLPGPPQLAVVLLARQMFENAVTGLWALRMPDGPSRVHFGSLQSRKALLELVRDVGLRSLDEHAQAISEVEDELANSPVRKGLPSFREQCRQLGAEKLYVLYKQASGLAHVGTAAGGRFLRDDGDSFALRIEPDFESTDDYGEMATTSLLLSVAVWNEYLPGRPFADVLDQYDDEVWFQRPLRAESLDVAD